MKKIITLSLLCLVALQGCQKNIPTQKMDSTSSSSKGVYLLSIAENGEVIEKKIRKNEYEGHLNNIIESVQESTIPNLQKKTNKSQWGLRTVLVGIGIKLNIGIGPLANYGFTPGIRFAFSNSKKPNVP